jgi:multidrug resistance efflux pump
MTLKVSKGRNWKGSLVLVLSGILFLMNSAAAPVPGIPLEQPERELELLVQDGGSLSVDGRLVPRHYVNLSTPSSGQVLELNVEEGEWVEAGDVLLRLDGEEGLLAEKARLQLELVNARRALDDLYLKADVKLALAEKSLAESERVLAFAEDKVEGLKRATPQADIDRVYANLNLAVKRLEDIEEEIEKTENKFANKDSLWWWFLDRRDFRQLLTSLDKTKANAERRVIDAQQKYDELREPADPVDLAMAESDLALAQVNVAELERQIEDLQDGPDPDEVALVEARIRAAEAGLAATEVALEELALVAPVPGKVIDLGVKEGEWADGSRAVIQLADTRQWVVETNDLTENDVPSVYPGQAASVVPDALPELELGGEVESISGLYEEKRGDITYTARMKLNESDPRLRWGMSVVVTFED